MPTYEYLCYECQHAFEQFQNITAEPLSICPSCGKNALRRLIGKGSAVLFKGSGFYQTDYKSKRLAKEEGQTEPPPTET